MSDFLTRLAERTLGLVPVSQPIIAPMFAPNTLNDNPPGLVQSNGSQGALDKTQATPTQESSPGFSQSDLMAEALLSDSMIGSDNNGIFKPISKSVSSKGLPKGKRNGSQGALDKTQATPTQESSLGFSQSDLMAEALLSDSMIGSDNNGIFKPISKSVNSKGLPKGKRSKENISDLNESNEPSIDRAISEQNQKNSLEHSLNVEKVVSGPRIDLDTLNTTQREIPAAPEAQHAETSASMPFTHRRFRSQNVATPKSSSSTPTIQVTIGRIEVRAITPPVAPAQRSRTPSPTLSLDEYLKQRNGGQR